MGDRRSGQGSKSRGSQEGDQQSGQSNQPQPTRPPKPKLPMGNYGDNGRYVYGKEVHDIWVYRGFVNDAYARDSYNVRLEIHTYVDNGDVRHYTQNQIPRYNQDQEPPDNFNFSVRIPACLFAWLVEERYCWAKKRNKWIYRRQVQTRRNECGLPFTIYIANKDYWYDREARRVKRYNIQPLELYRKQAGAHLMINGSHIYDTNNRHSRWLLVAITYWYYNYTQNIWGYDIHYHLSVPFQCVHPSLTKPDGEQPKIIIGLLFLNKDKERKCIRTYERRKNSKMSKRVQDIYESFIELKEVQDGTEKETKDDAEKEAKTEQTVDKVSQDGKKETDGSEKTANNKFHYSNQTLFPVNEEAVAIYVCEGARLIIRDEFLYKLKNREIEEDHEEPNPEDSTQKISKHCRNLMQQGTLIVLTNCEFRLCMEIRKRHIMSEARDPNSHRHSYRWQDAHDMVPGLENKLNDEDKEDFDDEDSHEVTKLDQLNRKVLFIGANESQHNSISWLLVMNRDSNGSGIHSAELIAPEGGRLLDVTTWNTGFKLINCRHRYQKLYESLINGEALTSAQWMRFGTPNQQILERVLGIRNSHPMNIEPPERLFYIDETNSENLIPIKFSARLPINYHRVSYPQELVVNQIDSDVHRRIYGPQYKWVQVESDIDRIPVPPLYPPVYDNQTYSYTFKPEVKIAHYGGYPPVCKIGDNLNDEGKVYRLEFRNNCPEYKWSKCSATEVTSLSGYHSSNYRIGIDYQFYKKEGNQQIGQIGMWTLQVQSSNTSSQLSQPVPSLFSQVQNVGSHSGSSLSQPSTSGSQTGPSLSQPSASGSQSGSSRGQQSNSGPSQGNTSSDQNQSKRGGQRRRQNK